MIGKKLVDYNFPIPYELGWKLSIVVFTFGLIATFIQKSSLEALKGTVFIGICFVIGAACTLLSASMHQVIYKAWSISLLAALFGAGISLGATVKCIFKFRVETNDIA
jgi:hypothetical protein